MGFRSMGFDGYARPMNRGNMIRQNRLALLASSLPRLSLFLAASIHYGATPANPNGGPWFGGLGSTGDCVALPVTDAVGMLEEAPSPLATWPGAATVCPFWHLSWTTDV